MLLGRESFSLSKLKKSKHWSAAFSRCERARELFPLTRLGGLVAFGTGLGLWNFGFAQHDLVWYVAAISGLALIILALMMVLLGSAYVSKSMRSLTNKITQQGVTDIPWTSEFTLPSLRLFPLLDIQLEWAKPCGSVVELLLDDDQTKERVTLVEHGDFERVERCIKVLDVLGLASMTLRYSSPANIAVLPNRGGLARVPWLASLNDGEDLPHPSGAAVGDRLELRRYHAGDPARFIHWKAFARTGKLMQREPERSLSRTHRTAAYLVAGPADGASAAAALAVLDASALGIDWVFAADGMPEPLESKNEVEAAIRHSASQRDKGGEGLLNFIACVEQGGAFNLMLFVPSCSGAWEANVTTALAKSNLKCKIIIGIDGLKQQQNVSAWYQGWRKFLIQSEPIMGLDVQELDQLVARLEVAGGTVLIADRSSGRLLNRPQLSAQIAAKKTIKLETGRLARKGT